MQVMRLSLCLSLPTDKMNNKADDAVQNTKMSSCHDVNSQQSLVTKPMAAELSGVPRNENAVHLGAGASSLSY